MLFPSEAMVEKREKVEMFRDLIALQICERLKASGIKLTFYCAVCGHLINFVHCELCSECWKKRQADRLAQANRPFTESEKQVLFGDK